MIKTPKGSRFTLISHRFQEMIRVFQNMFSTTTTTSRVIRSKSSRMKWKPYSEYQSKRLSWFRSHTHFLKQEEAIRVGFGSGGAPGKRDRRMKRLARKRERARSTTVTQAGFLWFFFFFWLLDFYSLKQKQKLNQGKICKIILF